MVSKAIVLATLLALAACQMPGRIENPRQIWCEQNSPRRDATLDTPRVELDEINAHNAKGAMWCGWRP